MKKNLLLLRSAFLGLFLLTAVSCSDDDGDGNNQAGPTIADLAAATADLSNLYAALERADLVATLDGSTEYTVFAPTNAAFETFLADNNFSGLEDVPVDVLTQVLLNHVVVGEALSTSLSTGYVSSASTAGPGGANLSLYVNTASGVSVNGVSNVTDADIDASNGVVHIVDAVIGLPNIVDHAVANDSFSTLVTVLTAGGNTTFIDLLSDDTETYTVFAPVNDAFASFNNTNGNDINNILSNHVIAGAAAFSSTLTNSYVNTLGTNADGDFLSAYINTDTGVSINGIADVAVADVVATNGVIHAVDAVIDIPTVVTFAVADPNFSTLVQALTELTPATDFAGILSRTETGNGDGIDPDFTVFAPVNSAFDALSAIPGESELTPILLHHVVAGANIRSGDLNNPGNTPATTLEGDDIIITLPATDNGVNIADVTDGSGNTGIGIIAVDVQAGNGVIHVLDQVLIPDTSN
ncbi:fasciclin domain-containing protein [Robiginitalea sp. IMCC43444]|uniref:fasciclin domain-containing protein n=1 Tax=Robiginitalea sp. IMCC43444 TaxID=3459121 RepID=UPI004040EA91